MTDKEFFKNLKRDSLEYDERFEVGFGSFCLKIFFDLNEEQIEAAQYGLSGNDDSIDAFLHLEDQNQIHFFQFKSAQTMELKPLKKEWISYMMDIPNKLMNSEYVNQHRNEKVKDIAIEYINNVEHSEVYFHFFHLGYNSNVALINIHPNLKYYGFEEIKEQYLEYESKSYTNGPDEIELKLSYDEDPVVIDKKIGDHHTLVSLITGDEIVRLRQEFKYKLFDKNLRFSLGMNKINKNIVDSAKQSKENFYFFNNGITITASSFKHRDNNHTVRIDEPQIINGAQTVNAIYEAFNERVKKLSIDQKSKEDAQKQAKEEFSNLKVLFRIIQNNRTKNESFETNVIAFNNTQNAIKKRDFYANEPEQIELQRYFAKEGYFYEIKRGERDYLKKKNHHNILGIKLSELTYSDEKRNIETLASLWMAYYKQRPISKIVGKDYIFGNANEYQGLFPKSKSDITIELVKQMIFAYNMFDIIEKESKIYRGAYSILNLLNDQKKDKKDNFIKINSVINESILFNQILKNLISDRDIFHERYDDIFTSVKSFHPISVGKYFTLALFKLVIDKCDYLDALLNHNIHINKKFIKENIVSPWIKVLLKDILVPVHDKYMEDIGGTINSFYHSQEQYELMKKRLDKLDIEKDTEFREIFSLSL